jgi:hypothetical protein
MKRFVIAFALFAFVVGFAAIVTPPTTSAAAGGTNCEDPQPGKGKSKTNNCEPVECGPCEELVCAGNSRCPGCQLIPDCVP